MSSIASRMRGVGDARSPFITELCVAATIARWNSRSTSTSSPSDASSTARRFPIATSIAALRTTSAHATSGSSRTT
ncbi:hypothetical protein H4W33_005526 [Kibdelosporangium phytohabitans]|nr:hypothetical protein [Kibdelosporangium phytohabitans]